MKMLKKTIAAVSLLFLGSTAAQADDLFSIIFDFEEGNTPTVIDPIGAISVTSTYGSTGPTAPTQFFFDFAVSPLYFASLDLLFYTTNAAGTVSRAIFDGSQIGFATAMPFNIFNPGLSGLTGGTVGVESIAFAPNQSFGLEYLVVSGTLSAVPETGTLLLSGLGVLGFVAVYRKRRSASVDANAA